MTTPLSLGALALALLLGLGCGGPDVGLNYGTNYCTPARVKDGVVVHAVSGQPYEWKPRRKRDGDVTAEIKWADHRRLKKKYCQGNAREYPLRFRTKICFVADGSVVSAEVVVPSEAPDFDRNFEKAALETRYCPFPEGAPSDKPICVTTNRDLAVSCEI